MNPTPITVYTAEGPLQLPQGCTVAQALHSMWPDEPERAGHVATAVNGAFVARSAREGRVLADGDTLLCFTAITGG